MIRELLWDAGPGEIRCGLTEDGTLREFRIIRQRRDKALIQAGEHYTVRITRKLGGRQALVTMGLGEDGLLFPCPDLPEGALIAAQMTRAPVPEPGRWKRAKLCPADGIDARAEAGWHFSDEPWVLFLKRMAPDIDAIICPDPSTANEVDQDLKNDVAPPVRIDPDAIHAADFDSLIEAAVTGEFAIPGGVISIERTRAMTVIDIDGTGDTHAINRAAAAAIPPLLRLFDIGGSVAIDFITSANRAERLAVDAGLAEASACLGQHERTAINGFGLAQIIRRRTTQSIPEIICGTSLGQMSVESQAVALLRAAGKSRGIGKRRLVAAPAIIALIRQWPEETGALCSSLGAAIELVSDPSALGYGHVHVDQR
jgi:hypothetical protein